MSNHVRQIMLQKKVWEITAVATNQIYNQEKVGA
jgi:hypothetical protein